MNFAVIPNSLFIHFKVNVAKALQTGHGWPGAAGYELARKYPELVNSSWLAGATAAETAARIDAEYMGRPAKPFSYPTRASMEAVGCVYTEGE